MNKLLDFYKRPLMRAEKYNILNEKQLKEILKEMFDVGFYDYIIGNYSCYGLMEIIEGYELWYCVGYDYHIIMDKFVDTLSLYFKDVTPEYIEENIQMFHTIIEMYLIELYEKIEYYYNIIYDYEVARKNEENEYFSDCYVY